jgi:hypothetical protein
MLKQEINSTKSAHKIPYFASLIFFLLNALNKNSD